MEENVSENESHPQPPQYPTPPYPAPAYPAPQYAYPPQYAPRPDHAHPAAPPAEFRPPAGYPPIATIGRRIGGFVLDMLFYGLISATYSLPLSLASEAESNLGVAALLDAVSLGLDGVLFVLYFVVPTALRGVTLGKLCVGLRVVGEDGRVPGWGKAFGRQALLYLMILPCDIPAIICAFTMRSEPRNRGWHDRAAGTVVIHVR
ncbi:RDD family protein [Nocardioides sp. YIM 152588]|uniref:RDD family protein n=1 Tax=Nocardioides sp. YIM 152588 TaxID=3158259 RepID=UPI0032E43B1B